MLRSYENSSWCPPTLDDWSDIKRLRLRSHDAGRFWKRWKVWRIGLPFTRKRHIFCRQILKTVDFENRTLTGTFWKRHRVNTRKWCKQNIFRCFWNENGRFLECRFISLASKSYKEFYSVIFPTVFKLLRHRVNASSNSATVTFFIVFKMCRHRVNTV